MLQVISGEYRRVQYKPQKPQSAEERFDWLLRNQDKEREEKAERSWEEKKREEEKRSGKAIAAWTYFYGQNKCG